MSKIDAKGGRVNYREFMNKFKNTDVDVRL